MHCSTLYFFFSVTAASHFCTERVLLSVAAQLPHLATLTRSFPLNGGAITYLNHLISDIWLVPTHLLRSHCGE